MLRSLVGQAHTLWDSVGHRHELRVVGLHLEKHSMPRQFQKVLRQPGVPGTP